MQDQRVQSNTREVVWVQPSFWVEVKPVRITTRSDPAPSARK